MNMNEEWRNEDNASLEPSETKSSRPKSDNNVIEQRSAISRRSFLSAGASAAGTFLLSQSLGGIPAIAKPSSNSKVDPSLLQKEFNFKGKVITSSDADFEQAALATVWNELRPVRRPQLIAQVADEQDVVAAIKFARANKLKVAVRGGGHNWCSPSLRNGGMMIDLTNLNKVISIDPEARKAVLQPIVSNRQVQAYLNPQGLAFPSGHCPPVKISGYLLSGGMAWNQGVWGPGVGSVEAIEMVTPQGEMITASAKQHEDYFWAARGGGPGLFAVATRYHLKLYPLPKAITASVYYYPYEDLPAVAEWLAPAASKLPSSVELSIFLVNAPAELADKCKSSNGKVCLVTATMFAETADEAKEALSLLDSCPVIDKCLSQSVNQPTDFEKLFDASGALWPGNLRCKVDALFSNAKLTDIFGAVQEHFLNSTSAQTVLMFALFTGKDVPAPLLPDAAFSMSAKYYGGPWTMWQEAAQDKENIAWHAKCMELLKPHISGHYVSETDTAEHPEYARDSYKEANWNRLAELRKKYDPEGVFFDFADGIN